MTKPGILEMHFRISRRRASLLLPFSLFAQSSVPFPNLEIRLERLPQVIGRDLLAVVRLTPRALFERN
jgi:hypothetical protein